MNKGKKIAEKFKFLFNDIRKKIAAFAMLIFAVFSLIDIETLRFQPASFSQLEISEGKIKIGQPSAKGGTPFALVINKQEIYFHCGLGHSSDNCLQGKEAVKKYQGKIGKVWWAYERSGGKRLYQLEVAGETVISYQKQTDSYAISKESHFPHWIALFILSLYWFVKLQFKQRVDRTS